MSDGSGAQTDSADAVGAASADWLVLDPDESVVWSAHPRLMSILPAVAIGLLLVAAGVALPAVMGEPLAGLLVPVGFGLAVWRYLVVRNTWFVVTDRALYAKKGVLGRSVVRVGLERVQNSTYRQHPLGTLFGYGTVAIESADRRTVTFNDIYDPGDVRALVDAGADESAEMGRRFGDGTDGIPGTVEQWEAVLDEVRGLRHALEGDR